VLRTDTSGNPSFRELIARVRTTNLAAYSHQELPFERLVEVINPARSLARHPLFQVMLVLQNHAEEFGLDLPGLTTAFEPVATGSAKFDLSVSLGERRGSDGTPLGISGQLGIRHRPFDRVSVEAMAGRLIRLLAAAIADADQPIGSLDILAPPSGARSFRSGTTLRVQSRPPPCRSCSRRRSQKTPDATASCSRTSGLTYAQLDARANQLAHHLRRTRGRPEVVVGLASSAH